MRTCLEEMFKGCVYGEVVPMDFSYLGRRNRHTMYPLDAVDVAPRHRFACGRPDKLVRSVEPSVPQQRGGVAGAQEPVATRVQSLWQGC